MFLTSIFSNGDIGSDDYIEKCLLIDYTGYVLRLEHVKECISRLEYEKKYLEERIDKYDQI